MLRKNFEIVVDIDATMQRAVVSNIIIYVIRMNVALYCYVDQMARGNIENWGFGGGAPGNVFGDL